VLHYKEWKYKGYGSLYGKGIARADVVKQRDDTKATLESLLNRANADLAACLYRELRPIIARYEALKARAGKLDFVDLLVKTRDLVRSDRGVREALQSRFSHVFVDEFQDTDPIQAEILVLLSADDPGEDRYERVRPVPGKLFVV